MLIDEPFSNLNVELRERLSLEMRDTLKRKATTALIVTHDYTLKLPSCERVVAGAFPSSSHHRRKNRHQANCQPCRGVSDE